MQITVPPRYRRRLTFDQFMAVAEEIVDLAAWLRSRGPDLLDRAQEEARDRCFPGGASGVSSTSGVAETTLTERLAIALAMGEAPPDPVGELATGMCEALTVGRDVLRRAKATCLMALPETIVRRDENRRISRSLALCLVCGESDRGRLRRGLCEREYKAWVRAGRPDIELFRAQWLVAKRADEIDEAA